MIQFNFIRVRKRLIASISLFIIGVGLGVFSVYYSLANINGGFGAAINVIVYMLAGYASVLVSQLLLFSEVWKIGGLSRDTHAKRSEEIEE